MGNSEKDLHITSSLSSTEIEFSKQVKECQQHLYHMEKLFINLQKDSEKLLQNSHSSLNNFDDSLTGKSNSARSEKETLNIQDKPKPNEDKSPLRFIIEVPNSILNILRGKFSNNDLYNSSSQCASETPKSGFIPFMRRLFKKKEDKITPTVSENGELFQLFKEDLERRSHDSSQSSNMSGLNSILEMKNSNSMKKSSIVENLSKTIIDTKDTNVKEGQTVIFPITYNFAGKSSETPNANFTIQHEITPQCSTNSILHSIKITNEIQKENQNSSSSRIRNETQEIEDQNYELISTKIFLEKLMKTLMKTTEKLDNLDKLEKFLEALSKNDIVSENVGCCKTKSKRQCINREIRTPNYELKNVKSHKKCKNQSKSSDKYSQQMLRKQFSNPSMYASTVNLSSDRDWYKYSGHLKPKHIHKHRRCYSPSMFNYLVCQSERDR